MGLVKKQARIQEERPRVMHGLKHDGKLTLGYYAELHDNTPQMRDPPIDTVSKTYYKVE